MRATAPPMLLPPRSEERYLEGDEVEPSRTGENAPSVVRSWALAALAGQARTTTPSVADLLERLCRAVADGLEVAGAAVDVRSGPDSEANVAVSDEVTRDRARLEFNLGEGPSKAAYARGRSVSVPDMAAPTAAAWAGWGPAARAAGIAAVFAFPLQVGAAKFGVLTMYSTAPRSLDRVEYARCWAMAELATEILLASAETSADGELDASLRGVLGFRNEVYQAQGMVMVALGVSLAEALARMRAHAFASDRDLADVALDIVGGGLRLSDDRT